MQAKDQVYCRCITYSVGDAKKDPTVILTISLSGSKLAHMTNQQFGAFAAYCYKLKNFHSIEMWKTAVEVKFNFNNLESVPTGLNAQAELEEAISVFGSMEPFPCPCGCGAFISVSPCHRQSGALTDKPALNEEEQDMVLRGNPIGAISSLRRRYGKMDANGVLSSYLGLKEAKDVVDAWRETNDPRYLKRNKF